MKIKNKPLQLMSSASGLSKDEIIHGFDSTKLMTLRDNLMSMTKSTGNMSSMYTLGEDASNFFTQNGVMSDYANIDAIIESTIRQGYCQREKDFYCRKLAQVVRIRIKYGCNFASDQTFFCPSCPNRILNCFHFVRSISAPF